MSSPFAIHNVALSAGHHLDEPDRLARLMQVFEQQSMDIQAGRTSPPRTDALVFWLTSSLTTEVVDAIIAAGTNQAACEAVVTRAGLTTTNRATLLAGIEVQVAPWLRLPVALRLLQGSAEWNEVIAKKWNMCDVTHEEILDVLALFSAQPDRLNELIPILVKSIAPWPSVESVAFVKRICALLPADTTEPDDEKFIKGRHNALHRLITWCTADVGTSSEDHTPLLVSLLDAFNDKEYALRTILINWPYAVRGEDLPPLASGDGIFIANDHAKQGKRLRHRQFLAARHNLLARADTPAAAVPCKVCFANESAVLLVQCKHLCLCRACFQRIEKNECPICQQPIAQAVEVIIP